MIPVFQLWYNGFDISHSDIGKIHEAIGDKGSTAIQYYTASISSLVSCFVFGWELTLVLQIASPFIFFAFAAIGIVCIKGKSNHLK